MPFARIISNITPHKPYEIYIRHCCCYYHHDLVVSHLHHLGNLPEFNQLVYDRKMYFLTFCIFETCKAILAQKLDCQCNVTDQLIAYFMYALDEYKIFHVKLASNLDSELNAKINHYIELSSKMIELNDFCFCSTSGLEQFIVDMFTIFSPKV